MALFLIIMLMLSLLSIPAAAAVNPVYVVTTGATHGTSYYVYKSTNGGTIFSQLGSSYDTANAAVGALVTDTGMYSATIYFGDTGTDISSLKDTLDTGSTGIGLGGSVTYTLKGRITSSSGSNTIEASVPNIVVDGATIANTSTGDGICSSGAGFVTLKSGTINAYVGIGSYSGSGTISVQGGTISSSHSGIFTDNNSTATVSISDGSISSVSGHAVDNEGVGSVTISGGTLSSSGNNAVYGNSTGKITISDTADISTSSVYAAVWLNTGTAGATALEMTGGTVKNTNNGAVTMTSNTPTAIGNCGVGTVEISGGTIQSNGFGIGNETTGAIKISGGAINIGAAGYGVANGSTGSVYLSGTPTFSGGVADLVEVSSGAIHASDAVGSNYTGDALSVYYYGSITSGTTVAVADVTSGTNSTKFTIANDGYYLSLTDTELRINVHAAKNTTTNTYYDDVYTALNAAADGETVKLLSDVATTSCITFNRSGVSVSLDLNGHTLIRTADLTAETETNAVVYVQAGTLTIQDTTAAADGYIQMVDSAAAFMNGSGVNIGAGGEVILLSGGILGSGQALYAYESGAQFNMSGGVLYGNYNGTSCEALAAASGAYIGISGGCIGTLNSSAAMIWSASTLNTSYWSISGGYFTSQYYNDGSQKEIANFVTSGTVTELTTPITNTISGTLGYAYHLTIPRTITFNATTNGGTCTTASDDTASTGKLSSLPVASKSGMYFNGWYTSASGGTKITTDYAFDTSATVYAQFVTGFMCNYYSSDGGTLLCSSTLPLSGDKVLDDYAPTKTGKDFIGWATDANSSTLAYLPGWDYTSVYNAADPKPESLSLYAIWEDITYPNCSTNTITGETTSYSGPKDTTVSNSFTIGNDEGQIAQARVRADLIVDGYDVDTLEEDKIYLVDDTAHTEYYLGIMTGADGTWNSTLFSIPQYYLVNGHNYHIRLTVPAGFAFGIRGIYLLIDGGSGAVYFDGSSLSLSYSSGALAAATSVTTTSAGTYSLEYKLSSIDASGNYAQLACATSDDIEIDEDVTIADNKIMGVTLAQNTKYQMDIVIKNGLFPVAIISRTFYLYTYSYDLNGGIGTTSDGYVISGEKLTAPADPTNSGKVFSGWYTDAGCTDKWDFDTDVADDVIALYAGWLSIASERTISVTNVTSDVFKDANKSLFSAQANMQNAFSDSVEVRVTDDKTESDAITALIGGDGKVYPFDISLYIKNTDTKTEPASGYAVTITMPLPEALWAQRETLSLVHNANGKLETLPFTLSQKGGVWCITFEATSFSPYALVLGSGLPYYLDTAGAKVFIGFASDAGGTMKYIEKTGKTISFAANPKCFTDISGHWAKDNIDFVTERELFLGTGENIFSPDSGMTRAMFATVLGRLFERSYGAIASVSTGNFTDVTYTQWYGKYVAWASDNAIITGVGGGKFQPDTQITRQEMAAMLYRFARFLDVLSADSSTATLTYPDASSISDWAAEAAMYCQKTGIITGRDGGYFAPQKTASRAEVAVILERFINIVLG